FANDVAAVLGLQRGPRLSPVPPTRQGADLDARTELLRRSAAMPSTRRPPPRRNRRLMPIVAGAVVILGGAGAALARPGGRKTAPWIRDSAIHLFNAPGIARDDKAYAAFVCGMALAQMNDRARGCEWIRKAVELQPADTFYPKIAAQCGR